MPYQEGDSGTPSHFSGKPVKAASMSETPDLSWHYITHFLIMSDKVLECCGLCCFLRGSGCYFGELCCVLLSFNFFLSKL